MLRSEGTQRRRTGPALRERPVPLSVPIAALGRGRGRAPQPPIRPGQSGKTARRKWPALLRQPESSCAWEGTGALGQGCCPGVLYVGAGVVAFPEGCSTSCVPSRGVQTAHLCFRAPRSHHGGDDTAKLVELDRCEGPVGQRTPGARHPTALAFRDQTRWPSGGPLGPGSEPGWVLRG